MPKYVIRVELHEPIPPGAYDALHRVMEQGGAVARIADASGRVHHLPSATYCVNTHVPVAGLVEWAKRVATECAPPPSPDPWVLALPSAEAAFSLPYAGHDEPPEEP